MERGEVFPCGGEGDLEWKEIFRACWYGVEGRELDCCEVNGGRFFASGDVSVDNFHGMFEAFRAATGDLPPGMEDSLAFPWVSGII